MKAYLDHAAATPVAPEVAEAMIYAYTEEYGNPSSSHDIGKEANEKVEKARKTIAQKIRCETTELYFTSGGCESNSWAGHIAKKIAEKSGKKHFCISSIEHSSLINFGKQIEQEGYEVTWLKVDNEGYVKNEELIGSIREDTALVSVMHANNEIGTIERIEELGKICKEKGILFHSDATQTLTRVPIDVKKMGVDMMSLCAHKINGPKGIGALYIREGIDVIPLIFGGSHEFGKRGGTQNVPGIVGFEKAVEINTTETVQEIEKMRNRLIEGVLKIEGTRLNGPKERICNNAHITFKGIEAGVLLEHMNAKGVYASAGSACDSERLEPSHVLKAIGMASSEAHQSVRLSVGLTTTKEEVDYACEVITNVVKNLRNLGRK